MSTEPMPKCPQCGATLPPDAPDGLCPECVMAMSLQTETVCTDGTPAAQPPLPPGEIAPHFPQLEILDCLGRGGMGVVYKARQKSLNRFAALKLLAPERVGDAAFAERFAREAQALAALNHPNIITIYDFGQAGGFYYLLMEFVDGLNLRQLLRTRKFSPEEALAIVPPLCDALQFAHDRGIVHRDIKPENLLLDKTGRVKVADFGIVKMLGKGGDGGPTGDSAAPDTVTQNAVGTPGYSAPEQKTDPQRVDSRADIYSLGVVFYELLTGELPGNRIEAPSQKVRIDVRLDEIVLRALEKKPELRYQQASVLKTQVEHVAATPSIKPTPREQSNHMTTFEFFCPQCGQRVQCDKSQSGAPINCPVCHQAIVVPSAPQAGSASLPPGRAGSRTWQNVLVLAGGAVVLAGMAIGGWHGCSKIKIQSSIRQLPPGVVAFWSGGPNDLVGGNQGQLVNGVGFAPGKSGRAFALKNGEGGEPGANSRHSAYVQVETSPALDVGKGDGFTFECWIKPVGVHQEMLIAEFERELGTYSGMDVGIDFAIQPPANLVANVVDDAAPNRSNHILATAPNVVTAGVWQQVALTYDKASGMEALYINGTVAAETNCGSFTPQTSFPYLVLGARTTFGSVEHPRSAFSGEMDEVGVFKRALSAAEIQALYRKQK